MMTNILLIFFNSKTSAHIGTLFTTLELVIVRVVTVTVIIITVILCATVSLTNRSRTNATQKHAQSQIPHIACYFIKEPYIL